MTASAPSIRSVSDVGRFNLGGVSVLDHRFRASVMRRSMAGRSLMGHLDHAALDEDRLQRKFHASRRGPPSPRQTPARSPRGFRWLRAFQLAITGTRQPTQSITSSQDRCRQGPHEWPTPPRSTPGAARTRTPQWSFSIDRRCRTHPMHRAQALLLLLTGPPLGDRTHHVVPVNVLDDQSTCRRRPAAGPRRQPIGPAACTSSTRGSWVPSQSASMRTVSPFTQTVGPSANRPNRIFGPCTRSARMPTARPVASQGPAHPPDGRPRGRRNHTVTEVGRATSIGHFAFHGLVSAGRRAEEYRRSCRVGSRRLSIVRGGRPAIQTNHSPFGLLRRETVGAKESPANCATVPRDGSHR